MMYNKKTYESYKSGEIGKEELVAHLLSNNTLQEIMDYVIDAIEKNNEDNTPIVVSEPEFQRILSLFRIKGIVKLDNGEVAPQRRGRPRKTSTPFNDVEIPSTYGTPMGSKGNVVKVPDYPSEPEIFNDGDTTEK